MKKHLTDAAIQRFRIPASGQLEIFDLGYPGLALRIGHGGAKSFVLFYHHGGKLRRVTLGRWPEVSLAGARDAWRKTREAIAKGETPAGKTQSTGMAFEFVVEDWLRRDQSKNKASSLYQLGKMVEHDLLPAWRGRHVEQISKRDVIALLDTIADRAPVKARRVYAHLHRLFKWCAMRELIATNPMLGIEKPGSEQSRERVLSDDELAKVWKGAENEGPFGTIARLLILTGARKEEIGQLKWSEIQDGHILLANGRTKNGKAHIIPLSVPARKLLDNVRRIGDSDFVFTLDGAKPVSGWSRAKARLDAASGVTDWRLHDLRRTLATNLQRLGVTLQTVEAILGHTSGSRAGVIGVYQRHDYAAEKRAALEAWAKHVTALIRESRADS
jgi:integrase